MEIRTVLTIAGSDSSGGAGIQADIKTIMANGCYAMSAITALTAQNTKGVYAIEETSPEFLQKQIEAVFDDIRPDAVKIGMVSSAEHIEVIADCLEYYGAGNIVVDPVMVSTSGSRLLAGDAVDVLCSRLFTVADIVTPNIPEAQTLASVSINSDEDMLEACRLLSEAYKIPVLVKGGHLECSARDVLVSGGRVIWYDGEYVKSENTHGTGCTLSSGIAAGLAKGLTLEDSVYQAKEYISGALRSNINLGGGNGPINHGWRYFFNV